MTALFALFVAGIVGDLLALLSQSEFVNGGVFTESQNLTGDYFSLAAESLVLSAGAGMAAVIRRAAGRVGEALAVPSRWLAVAVVLTIVYVASAKLPVLVLGSDGMPYWLDLVGTGSGLLAFSAYPLGLLSLRRRVGGRQGRRLGRAVLLFVLFWLTGVAIVAVQLFADLPPWAAAAGVLTAAGCLTVHGGMVCRLTSGDVGK